MSDADPVRARRAQLALLADAGQKLGYGLFGVAVVAFLVALFADLGTTAVAVCIGSLVLGSIVLAPAIVLGFAVKAADREDREAGR